MLVILLAPVYSPCQRYVYAHDQAASTLSVLPIFTACLLVLEVCLVLFNQASTASSSGGLEICTVAKPSQCLYLLLFFPGGFADLPFSSVLSHLSESQVVCSFDSLPPSSPTKSLHFSTAAMSSTAIPPHPARFMDSRYAGRARVQRFVCGLCKQRFRHDDYQGNKNMSARRHIEEEHPGVAHS